MGMWITIPPFNSTRRALGPIMNMNEIINAVPAMSIYWAIPEIPSSHQGILSGVSSFRCSSSKIRVGGNCTCCGRGGMNRSNHQMTGKASKAAKAHGV